MSFTPAKLKELKLFCDTVKQNPNLLHTPELQFFKEFLQSYGATIPEPTKKAETPKTEASKEEPKKEEEKPPKVEEVPKEEEEEEEPEEPDEPDTELMEPDNDPPLETGDTSVEVTEEMRDAASELRAKAMEAEREGRLQESLDLYTQAIKKNPKAGILYASRAQLLLSMKKPNAAIRDCNTATSINPDSAKPYKVRGRAERALGNYEAALRDIQRGQKLDWDEATHKLEAEIKPRAEKIINKKLRQERKQREKAQREREQREREIREARKRAAEEARKRQEQEAAEEEAMPEMPLPPGVSPEMFASIMNDPEILAAMQDPSIMSKLQEIMRDPSAIGKYQNDPKVQNLFNKFAGKFGGAPGGGFGGFGGAAPGGGFGGAPGGGASSFPFSQDVD